MGAAQVAFTTALVYTIISVVSSYYAHNFITRPITVVPILGWALGNLQLGLVLGAQLELLFMGITSIGGSIPSDIFLGSTLVGALVIGLGLDTKAGLALSVAVGVVAAFLKLASRIFIMGLWIPFFEKFAREGKTRAFFQLGIWGTLPQHIPQIIVVYVGVYLGGDAVTAFLKAMPLWLQGGLSVAAGMMPAVGIAMLGNMLWSGKMSIYLIFGFAVSAFLGVSMVGMVFIAAFITLVVVYQQMDLRNGLKSVKGGGAKEDDLFG